MHCIVCGEVFAMVPGVYRDSINASRQLIVKPSKRGKEKIFRAALMQCKSSRISGEFWVLTGFGNLWKGRKIEKNEKTFS
jgi:hypothetical protein